MRLFIPAGTIVAPGVNGYAPELDQPLPFDPEKTKALLVEAGYPDGFSVTLDGANDWGDDEIAACEGIAEQLGAVGIEVAIDWLSTDEYDAKIYNERESDFHIDGWHMDPDSEELLQRGGDLIHLRLAMRARVTLVRAHPVDRPQLDPVRQRDQGPCGASPCFQSQGCDAMLSGYLEHSPRSWLGGRQENVAPQRRFSSCLGGSSMPNPWISVWLSAANAWAGAVRGFWTAEMRRQQTAMINEMTRQMVRFWTGAWAQPSSNARNGKKRR